MRNDRILSYYIPHNAAFKCGFALEDSTYLIVSVICRAGKTVIYD